MTIDEFNEKSLKIHSAYENEDVEGGNLLLDDLTYCFLESIALQKCDSPGRISNLLISLYDRKMGYA